MNCQLAYDRRDSRPVEIELVSADGRLVIGTAQRAGVTPPRYALRYTYRVKHGYLYNPGRDAVPAGLYVLDAGQLVPLDEWYATHSPEPPQPIPQKPTRARQRRRG